MTSLTIFLTPLALLLPALAAPYDESPSDPAAVFATEVAHAAPEPGRPEMSFTSGDASAALRVLEQAHRPPVQRQVRIESRVVIRISPGADEQHEEALASLPRRPITTTYAEIEHGDCVPIEKIVGYQAISDDRLLLFLRDRRILSAALERACSARAFYSGFYVERNEDGNLCVARDKLQSRSGVSCEIAALHRLVAVRD